MLSVASIQDQNKTGNTEVQMHEAERGGCEKSKTDGIYVLLSADVLVLLRDAYHLSDADSVLDVFELQTQILTSDSEHGSSLPGTRLWIQLVKGTN